MILAPAWYARRLGDRFSAIDEPAQPLPRPLRALAARPGLGRGLALGLLARRGTGVAVIRRARGTLPALLIAALPPARRRIFVLELIRRPRPPRRWRRALWWLWWRLVETPALRRGMAAGQVMTAWERDAYAAHYGLDPARLHHVAWPLREREDGEPPAPIRDPGRTVFASGRTATDWETLFAAARGAGWRLIAVCSRRELARVRELGSPLGAEVHAELAWEDYDRLLREADVCAIALTDRGLSSGHARLMSAVEAGVPVVATEVRALAGYLVADRTAVAVAPGDPAALRLAIDALLVDPARRRELRDAALARASSWTYREYFEALAALIATSTAPAPPSG